MKNYITITFLLYSIVFCNSCKKKIVEPEHKLKGRQLIYIEEGGNKYEIIDKKFHWYKNTKGQFREYIDSKDRKINFYRYNKDGYTLRFSATQSLKNSYVNISFISSFSISNLNILKDTIDFETLPTSDGYFNIDFTSPASDNVSYYACSGCNGNTNRNCKIRILNIDEEKERIELQLWFRVENYHNVQDAKFVYVYIDSNYKKY
jgi:hypothetical protein